MTYQAQHDATPSLPFDGAEAQVFRRADRLEDAFSGDGDIDLLVQENAADDLRGKLRARGFLRTFYRRFHDNISPGREDWMAGDPETRGPLHVDLHTEIRVGPRFAKSLRYFESDVPPGTVRNTSRGPVHIADPLRIARIEIARAAFQHLRLRNSYRFDFDAPLPDGLNVAGVDLPLVEVDGGFSIESGDLAEVQKAILRQNNKTSLALPALWLRHAARFAGYAALRIVDKLGLAHRPKRRLEGGGLSIAFLGPDGMGKSTQVDLIQDYFSKKFDTRSFYLGHSGRLASFIHSARSEHRIKGSAKPKANASKKAHAEDFARAIWGLWLGLTRLRKVRRAVKFADRGFLVFCDRWPQSLERGFMDGAVRRKTLKTWRVTEALFALEERIYRKIATIQPDMTFHLVAPFEVSAERKPGDINRVEFDRRLTLLTEIRATHLAIHEIDASPDAESVRRRLLHMVWERLVQDATDKIEGPTGGAHDAMWTKVSYSIGGQVVYALGQLAVLASIAHIHGAEAVGYFGLALAVVTPSFIFANLGLRPVQAIDQEGEFSFMEHAGFRVVTTACALFLCGMAAFALTDNMSVIRIVALYALAKSFESISDLAYGLYEKNERFDLVFRSSAARSLLTAVIFSGLLVAGAPLAAAFWAQLLVWAFIALLYDLPKALKLAEVQKFRPSITRSRFVRLLRRSAPFGGRGFLTGLQPSLLRIFVEANLGLAALGIFTNIIYIFQAGANMGNAIRHFLGPRFARLKLLDDFRKTGQVVVLIGIAIVLACVVGLAVAWGYGEPLLAFLFGAETSEHANLLVLVSVALAVRLLSAIPASLLYAHGGAVGQFWREFFLVGLVVATAPFLIPQSGLMGAGWVLLIVTTLRLVADTARAVWKILLAR